MSRIVGCAAFAVVYVLVLVGGEPASAGQRGGRGQDAPPQAIDYLTFAQGAVPVGMDGAGAMMGANFEHAVKVIIDGDVTGFTFVNRATGETDTEFVYELPARTTFTSAAMSCGGARRDGCRWSDHYSRREREGTSRSEISGALWPVGAP